MAHLILRDIEQRLADLPPQASVAFAVRCARRAQPVFSFGELLEIGEQEGSYSAVDRAIELASKSASVLYGDVSVLREASEIAAKVAKATTNLGGLAVYSGAAADAAADAALTASIAFFHIIAESDSTVTAARIAGAGAAARSAAAAAGSAAAAAVRYTTHYIPTNSNVDAAAHSAAAAADATPYTVVTIRDLELLEAAFQTKDAGGLGWSKDTPIFMEFFGPLWPDGAPFYWPVQEEPGEGLIIEFEVPADATDEEIVTRMTELALHANAAHRAHGGHGVEIDKVEVELAAVEVPA